jgi:hypothetical protein
MLLENKQPQQLKVFENAYASSKIDTTQYFNQLKGIRLNAWFLDGNLSKMQTKGNAENIYFALDDQQNFIGVNKSSSQIIEISFENGEASKVVFINQLQGKMTPIRQTSKEELKMRGFNWQEESRPKSKFDILSPKN